MTAPDCIFCKIIQHEIPSEIVYEDEWVTAFKDLSPAAPVHVLIVPKKHIASLTEAADGDAALLGRIQLAAANIAARMGIQDKGFRLINNCGADAGQVVMHVHYHMLGGKTLGWSPD